MARCLIGSLVMVSSLAQAEGPGAPAAGEERRLVPPHATHAALPYSDTPHLVIAPAGAAASDQRQPVLLWLAGTGGDPSMAPMAFLRTARNKGFRVIALSYPTTPAVAQVCTARRVAGMPDCAERFRRMRVFGDARFSLIDDRPEDAIVPRLAKLLQHLAAQPGGEAWAPYLEGEQPRWDRFVLAGQSQGGGMAAFLAKRHRVAGVLIFSGGWDLGPDGRLADWYRQASATPPERWHASYHVSEARASALAASYRDLGIPALQVHALDGPLASASPHADGIRNERHAPVWQAMLGMLPAHAGLQGPGSARP